MKLRSLLALVVLSAVAIVVAPAPAQADPGGGQPGCQKYDIIGVRGSGQEYDGPFQMGGTVGPAAQRIAQQLSYYGVVGNDIGYYSVPYPAVRVDNWRAINVVTGKYHESVEDGVAQVVSVVNADAARCPNMKIILVGFSQGAHVVHTALDRGLTAAGRNAIASVMLIADPIGKMSPYYAHRLDPETGGDHGTSGDSGILGGSSGHTINSGFWHKTVAICFYGDIVCTSNGGTANHGLYPTCCRMFTNVLAYWGAVVADKSSPPLGGGTVPPPPGPGTPVPPLPGDGGGSGGTTGLKADLNGDRIPDLLTQVDNGDVYVYRGSGAVNYTTTFWSGTKIGNWAGHTNLTLGDLNNDGKADLLSQVASTGDLYVYRGSGSINSSTTFWSGTHIGNWANHTNLVLGDLNNDGKADLLTQIAGQGDLYVYRGSGSVNASTTFWSGTRIGNWANHTNLSLGDLNNDGKADLLSQVVGSGDVYVYRGSGSVNSSTTFWSGNHIGNWANHTNLVLGDLNNDRKADLLSQIAGQGDLYVYRGSGSINSSTTFWSGTRIGNWANHTNLTN